MPFTDATIFVDKTVKPLLQQQPVQLRPVPPNYICVTCKKPGHLRSQCPELANVSMNKFSSKHANTKKKQFFCCCKGNIVHDVRPKYPTGIPKGAMVRANAGDPGAMLGPDGYVIPKIDQYILRVF